MGTSASNIDTNAYDVGTSGYGIPAWGYDIPTSGYDIATSGWRIATRTRGVARGRSPGERHRKGGRAEGLLGGLTKCRRTTNPFSVLPVPISPIGASEPLGATAASRSRNRSP